MSSRSVPTGAVPLPRWIAACESAFATLRAGQTCVVTGSVGTGKSLLVETVAHWFRAAGWRVESTRGTLPAAATFSGLSGNAVILIDDAERLSPSQLGIVERLARCPVLLAGAPGLAARDADRTIGLTRLTRDETADYAALWLRRARQPADRIQKAAVKRLDDLSAGVPRTLDAILSASLALAQSEAADRIRPPHIDAAAWQHVDHLASTRAPPPPGAPGDDTPPDWAQRLENAPLAPAYEPEPEPGIEPRFGRRRWHPLFRLLAAAAIGLSLGVTTLAGLQAVKHRTAVTAPASSSE